MTTRAASKRLEGASAGFRLLASHLSATSISPAMMKAADTRNCTKRLKSLHLPLSPLHTAPILSPSKRCLFPKLSLLRVKCLTTVERVVASIIVMCAAGRDQGLERTVAHWALSANHVLLALRG